MKWNTEYTGPGVGCSKTSQICNIFDVVAMTQGQICVVLLSTDKSGLLLSTDKVVWQILDRRQWNVAQTLLNATKTFPMRWLSLVIVGNTPIVIYAFKDRGKFERVGICQNIW